MRGAEVEKAARVRARMRRDIATQRGRNRRNSRPINTLRAASRATNARRRDIAGGRHGGAGLGPGAELGRRKRADAAPDQDEDRGRPHRGLRLPGLPLPGPTAAAARLEPAETQGRGAGANPAHERTRPILRVRPAERTVARMVHVLSPLSLDGVPRTGSVDTGAPAQHPAQTPQTPRPGTGRRPPTLAQRLLQRPQAVQPERSPWLFRSVLPQVNHQPESRTREIRTYGLAGGGTELNRSSLPRSGRSTTHRRQSVGLGPLVARNGSCPDGVKQDNGQIPASPCLRVSRCGGKRALPSHSTFPGTHHPSRLPPTPLAGTIIGVVNKTGSDLAFAP